MRLDGAERRRGDAGHRRALEGFREFLQREATPQVGGGGVPGTVLLAADKAVGQLADVVFPRRVVHHAQQEARGVDVAIGHEPPPVVVLLGAEDELGALVAQARLQHVVRFIQTLLTLRHVGHALQDIHPVDDRAGRPLIGRDGDAGRHAALCLAITRERFQCRQLAHVEVLARAPELALDLAFDEGDQAGLHRRGHIVGQREGGVDRRRFVCCREQVRGQDVAAAISLPIARRKVVGQTVAVEVARDLCDHALPQLAVAQADRFAGLLFEADEGVVGEVVAHAGQAFGELGLQRHLQSAAAGQCVGGHRDVERERPVELHQRRLLHRQRHGRDDALPHLQCIARTGIARGDVFSLYLPQDRLGTRLRELRRRRHHPRDFARFAGRDVDRLRRQREHRRARRGLDLHLLLRGVAQGELRAELIVFAYQWRQPADDLQVLRGLDGGLPGAE